MKATLTFTLPEERAEYEHAIRGADYRVALEELAEWLRGKYKHTEPEHWPDLSAIRDHFYGVLQDRGIEL